MALPSLRAHPPPECQFSPELEHRLVALAPCRLGVRTASHSVMPGGVVRRAAPTLRPARQARRGLCRQTQLHAGIDLPLGPREE
eukprot:3130723-Rhodomonas_salina.3